MGAQGKTAGGKILYNSFWFGLETILETVIFFGTSVAVARFLGPQKMGYFTYINFFVAIVTRTSGNGLAGATRKYMAEFLAVGKPGTAHAVYRLASRYQLLGAIGITVLGLGAILLYGDPNYRLMSCILMIAITPGVMSWVPAQANNAFEDVYPNTMSALGYLVSYAIVIFLTLYFHWDLVGIASATLVGRTVEVFLRTIPLNRKLRLIPLDELSTEIKHRIRRFCIQAMGLQLLTTIVFDRSEMFFLRYFSTFQQIAMYGISFGLADKLLLVPRTFGGATGITLMVESGRDATRVDSIVRNSCRYLLFVVFPVHLGAAAIAPGMLRFVYGEKYLAAIPVMIVASLLAIPRAFQDIPSTLLAAADRQNAVLKWVAVTGVVNIALDFLFIPKYGAVGAAWGNGLAQAFGIVALWIQARRIFVFGFPVIDTIRFFLASLVMAVAAYAISHAIPGWPGLVLAILAGIVVYLGMVKLFRALHESDRFRMAPIGNRLPGPMRSAFTMTLNFITPGN